MTALSPMDQPSIARTQRSDRGTWTLRQPIIASRAISRLSMPSTPLSAGARACGSLLIDREIARAREDRARLQAVEAADRVAEMRGVGIADILRQMREVDVLVGEVQQMPRALPGAERAERNAGLFLEQMQEARRRQIRPPRRSSPRSLARRQNLPSLDDRARHARIECRAAAALRRSTSVSNSALEKSSPA